MSDPESGTDLFSGTDSDANQMLRATQAAGAGDAVEAFSAVHTDLQQRVERYATCLDDGEANPDYLKGRLDEARSLNVSVGTVLLALTHPTEGVDDE